MKKILWFAVIWFLLAEVCGCTPPPTPNRRRGKVTMPSGTLLKIALTDSISTGKSLPGDHFSGSLTETLFIDGEIVFEKGTKVRGRIFDLREPRPLGGRALLHLVLTEIIHKDQSITIRTKHFVATGGDNLSGRIGDIGFGVNDRVDFFVASNVEF